jgi:hypothetical protein
MPLNYIKYIYIGIWNTLFSLVLFRVFLWLFQDLHYQFILLMTFICSNIQSHFTQRKFVWGANNHYLYELIRFYASSVASYFANVVLLAVLVRSTTFNIFTLQLAVTVLLLGFSFLSHSKLVFKKRVT